MFVEFGRDLAVYEVARNQGLPDDTPRDHPKVYRADVVDIRNIHARFIAAARTLVPELVAALKAARAEVTDRDEALDAVRAALKATRAENEQLRGDAEMWRDMQAMYRGMIR